MKKAALMLSALMLATVMAGCMSVNEKSPSTTAVKEGNTQPTVDGAQAVNVEEAEIPFIAENETVEIGEML